MLRSRGAFGILLLSLLPAAAVCAAAGGAAAFRIVAGPYSRKGPDDGPAAARFTLGGLTVTAAYLDPAARADFIRTLDPKAGDPFAAPAGSRESYNAFRVEFDNRSAADVTFQPGNVILITDRDDQIFPIDLTDLYRFAALGEVPDPQAVMDRAGALIFDLSTTIPKGRRLARLLVFGALPERWKEIRLHFSYLQIGTETHTLSFSFHRQALAG